MSENYFMGLDGFVWFTGVVEDRNDPDKLGRVRVRCLGFHTDDLNDIPTASLPWAHVMHPVTDPCMQGLGNSPSFLVEGSWVIGFFRDAVEKQQPIIIGSLPGIPKSAPDYSKGFNDPRSPFSSQAPYAGTPTYGPYPVDGFDYEMPSGHDLGEPDTNRLAQGEGAESHDALIKLRENRQTGIETATQPFLPTVSDAAVQEERGSFDEPHPRDTDYNNEDSEDYGLYRSGLYPYNHVFESESGHLTEVDDTPGNERTMRHHAAGTYEEIIADGSKTTKVIGDNFEIIMKDSDVYVGGSVNLTIGGSVRHLVKGNYHLEVEGNYTQKIHKNMRTKIGAGESGGNLEEEIKGNHSYNINNDVKGRVGGAVNETIEGDETHIINGKFKSVVQNAISFQSLTSEMKLNAKTDFSVTTVSGIVGLKAGSTANFKSTSTMTINSEADIDMDSGSTSKIDITAGTLIDLNAGTEIDADAPTINLN